MTTNETISFGGKNYRVAKTLGAGPETVKQLGIVEQAVIVGERGATRLLQVFANGNRRTIGGTGRVENEYAN